MSAPGNTLTVHVVAARAFSVKGGKPVDVYCSLSVSGKGPWKSKVSTNAFKAEPGTTEEELRWDEHCEFQLNDTDTKLVVHLNHKTLFGTTETMGELLFQLDRMPAFQPPAWFRLSKTGTSFDQQQQLTASAKDRGQLLLGFQFSNSLGSGATSVSTLSLNKLDKEKKLDRFRRKMQELGRKATGNAAVDSSNADSQSLASISIAAGRHQQLGHGHQGMSRRSSISSVTSGQLAFSSPSPNPPTSIPGDADDSVSMASGGGENFLLKGPLEQQQQRRGGSTFWTPDDKSARNESTPVHNLAERFAREGSEGRLAAAAEQQQQTPSSQRLRVKMRQKAEQLLHLRALGTPASKKQHSNMDSAMAAGAELGTSSTAGRRDSVASSSGFVSFGSGQLSALNEHTSPEHLLNVIRHLRRELLKKEERIRDLEEYTDHLITKVMASNPELLAASPKIGGARKLNKRGTANFI